MNKEEPLKLCTSIVFESYLCNGKFKLSTIEHKEISFMQLYDENLCINQFNEEIFDEMCKRLKDAIFKKGE